MSPTAWATAARSNPPFYRDHCQVLEQQHREACLAGGRAEQVLLAQQRERDGGGGHGERHAGDQRHGDALVGEQRYPCNGSPRGEHLRGAHAEDGAAQLPQPLRLELQADEEEEQHHAELGKVQHRVRIGDEAEAPGSDRHAGGEIAEHRAEADALEDRHGDHAGGEVDQGLLQKSVIFHMGRMFTWKTSRSTPSSSKSACARSPVR
jgi:hypothetical protein